MQRKTGLIAAAFCLLLSLAGCGSVNYRVNTVHFANRERSGSTEQSFWSEYDTMSGTELNYITLEEGGPLEFRITVTTTGGSLTVAVNDPEGDEIYNESYDGDAAFTLPVEAEGKYRIAMKGDGHGGGYVIEWGEKKEAEPS